MDILILKRQLKSTEGDTSNKESNEKEEQKNVTQPHENDKEDQQQKEKENHGPKQVVS